MNSEYLVVYIDETGINKTCFKGKGWKKKNNNENTVKTTNLANISIIVAIC